ncbi:sugar isomerase domain-containing protein [Paramicrobacterium agarici]|uniref:Putative phosphosugar-binding protein n=1 Tax=Paramicrobacterium agarici TaxID=630514 RepID=A0A2A9DT24_9MICO|nr:SIS domain-containing protein [Microbacterium agarici]PFG29122.1 putative phosphosugar-binding protein [Microbacterium agarici]
MTVTPTDFLTQATTRLTKLAADAEAGGLDRAIELMVDAIRAGGVVQAFGTGHSEAFAMEIAGRAGGLIPTNKIALRDVALYGSRRPEELAGSNLERESSVVDELFDVSLTGPNDVFIIASNSGVNGSIVGVALKAKELGRPVIAVTSLQHTAAVEPKHPSGKRLSEIADVVIDNLAPYGDATLEIGHGVSSGAISSITAAFIAQLLTIGVAQKLSESGDVPPMYISANIPGGDEHNHALEDLYRDRIRRSA